MQKIMRLTSKTETNFGNYTHLRGRYMRNIGCLLVQLVFLIVAAHVLADSARTTPALQRDGDLQAVAALAHRIAPWLDSKLLLERIAPDQNTRVFELESANNRLILRASDVPSAATGLSWYLKYYCHRSISHLGNNITPVTSLPRIPKPVRRVSPFEFRYCLNYCAFNYTFAFADWERWEHELDWMALNGVNLALAINGTEAVWQNTLRRIGYSDREIMDYIAGPAYTAFWLMGNLEGWGGPVTQRMIDERVTLQKKILTRMRELGIQPVIEGFFGMVPTSLTKKFPTARIIDQGPWNNFRRPMVLVPSDPLFTQLANIYYEESNKLYGPARFFGGDLFHEGGKTADLNVASVAAGVQNAMLRANPEAVWVLQAWQGNPKDALLQGLQRDRILVLDLDALNWEARKGFDHSPWVCCFINNFGENTGMFGNLKRLASEPPRALASPYGRMMKGIGGIMEGINNNPVVYDLLFEMAWHNEAVNVRQWLHSYAEYRYGKTTPEIDRAWQLLLETVYSTAARGESIFCARPSLQVEGVSTWGHTRIGYNAAKLEEAAREFLQPAKELKGVDAFQADAVNLVRQILANRGLNVYRQMVSAYEANDKARFNQAADTFRMLIRKQDTLVGTRREFLLGNWLAEAKGMAATEEEKILLEKNARMQITYWGPNDPAAVANDYAFKEWSGLLQDFYLTRWDMFIRDLNSRLDGTTPREPNYFAFGENWTKQRNEYPAAPSGDPVATALRVFSDAAAPQ